MTVEVVFLGVGEAFDGSVGNTSLLLRRNDGQATNDILLDCGFTAPYALWRYVGENDLAMVAISHFHGDHAAGLAPLLMKMLARQRKRPLTLVGPPGLEEHTRQVLQLHYPGYYDRLPFELHFFSLARGAEPFELESLPGISLAAALTRHSLTNYALRLDWTSGRLFYSGDGRPTPESRGLMQGVDLAVHEAYAWQEDLEHHGSVASALAAAEEAGASRLALVHLAAEVRRRHVPTGEGEKPDWHYSGDLPYSFVREGQRVLLP
jgi:ribonuclease BN (tRNA processing enzyme)